MFEQLINKFSGIFKKLRSKGKLSEQDVDSILKELRMVLLESDVHYRVVKDLIARVKERAGKRSIRECYTREMVIKILWDEIRKVLGGNVSSLETGGATPVLIMLVGLQAIGKDNHSGKLAVRLKIKDFFLWQFQLILAVPLQRAVSDSVSQFGD